MKEPDIRRHISETPLSTSENSSFSDCVNQAEICCEQARRAARQRRYKTCCNLFSSAALLYTQAMQLDGVTYHTLEERVKSIDVEIKYYASLSKSPSQEFPAVSFSTQQLAA